MPQLLERVRIRAFNPNHDEKGRFAESDSAGGDEGELLTDFLPDDPPAPKDEPKPKGDAAKKSDGGLPKESPKAAARRADIMKRSAPAKAQEYYHGTAVSNIDSILKDGIKPTDKTMGFSAAFAGGESLAFSYGSGAAAARGDKEVAMVILKGGERSGLLNPPGNSGIAYKPGTITPDQIDRIEVHSVNAQKGDKPLRVVRPSVKAHYLHRAVLIPGVGRELPRVTAMNPNHDELGRFAESDSGGSSSSESRPKGRIDKVREARDAYRSARRAEFESAKSESRADIAKADAAHKTVADLRDSVPSAHESTDRPNRQFTKAFYKLDEHVQDFDADMTRGEKFSHFAKTQKLATKAAEQLAAVVPADAPDRLTESERDEAKANLRQIIKHAKEAKQSLRDSAAKLRDAKRIRDNDIEAMFRALLAFNPNHDERGRFAESAGEGGNYGDGGSSGSSIKDLHEEAGRLAREIAVVTQKSYKEGRSRSKEFLDRTSELEKRSKDAIAAIPGKELMQAAKDILGFEPKGWTQAKLRDTLAKSIRDRLGAALRQGI